MKRARTIKRLRWPWQALFGLCCILPPRIAADAPQPTPFSSLAPGSTIAGWQKLKPAPGATDTRYVLVEDGGRVVVRADAEAAMSGLLFEFGGVPARPGILRWRWKVEAPLSAADLATRSGDDYVARVYVLFDYPRARLPMATRARLRLLELLHGQRLPTAALNYVWDNRHPVGTLRANAYTERVRMIVVESGAGRAGRWVDEARDLRADFRQAFGEEAPSVIGIAIATDTDNTGETARAWFGDLRLDVD
jgi:hypothetical protein